ncbi:hypothetical protein ACYOEI_16795, partial [Singulisphaera rosea]
GIADEKPLAVSGVTADVPLPAGATLRSVRFLTPEHTEGRLIDAKTVEGRVRLEIPEFLVYGVARIEYQPAD